MKPILVFDADGVLINGKLFSQHLVDDLGITADMTKTFFTTIFNDCLEGKKDLKTEIAPHLKQWGWDKDTESFLLYWFESERNVDQELLDLIQIARSRGFRCFVATNQEHHRANYMLKEMHFGQLFDGLYSSADLGVKKPNTIFFERLYEKIGSPPKESVWFFDDTQKNIEAASEFGIQARHYTTFDDFLDVIRKETALSELRL